MIDPDDHIIQFFGSDERTATLRALSRSFHELANQLVYTLPRNPERTVALRKLLECRDAAIRAQTARD